MTEVIVADVLNWIYQPGSASGPVVPIILPAGYTKYVLEINGNPGLVATFEKPKTALFDGYALALQRTEEAREIYVGKAFTAGSIFMTEPLFLWSAGETGRNFQSGRFDDVLYGNNLSNQLAGGRGDDLLWGGRGNDLLKGGAGDDCLVGGPGDDTVIGGLGDDIIDIGEQSQGRDTVVLNAPGEGVDEIVGFDSAEDRLRIKFIGEANFRLSSQQAGTTIVAEFIYNPASGSLAFDPDGAGFDVATEIARFRPGTLISNEDLWFG